MNILQELQAIVGSGRVRENEPMDQHTTFKIGGPAQYYIDVQKVTELIDIVKAAHTYSMPVRTLGSGSAMVVSQKGIEGIVIKNNCRKFDFMSMVGKVQNQKVNVNNALLFAESGAIMSQVVRFCIEQGFSGLEHQLGLPGTVGGAVYMNAHNAETDHAIGSVVYRARLLDKTGEVKEVDQTYFHFQYDQSTIQRTGEILLSAVFQLSPAPKDELWKVATEALNYRTTMQPKGVVGCTFRNMWVLDAKNMAKIDGMNVVRQYIEKAGLSNKQIGGALLAQDPNFIINSGNATQEDVEMLVEFLRRELYKRFGVQLVLAAKIID